MKSRTPPQPTAIPADLQDALSGDPVARERWDDLTPLGRRDFLSWIAEARQAATRSKRIATACSMLEDGKRRPCCFALVPLDLHRGLQADAAAKAGWDDLTGDERRDFADWIRAAKTPADVRGRADEARAMIAAGRRGP